MGSPPGAWGDSVPPGQRPTRRPAPLATARALLALSLLLALALPLPAQTPYPLSAATADTLTRLDLPTALAPFDSGGDGHRRASGITEPFVVFYRGRGSLASPRPAILICPGGGYSILSFDKEGIDVARRLQAAGVSAAVLMSRLPNREVDTLPRLEALVDARAGLALLRHHAAELAVDSSRVGVMGFSAGGHLAMLASTDDAADGAHRPDVSALVYPVISAVADYRHKSSAAAIVGNDPPDSLARAYSGEYRVDADTPPTFLAHSADDGSVPVLNSLAYATALDAAGVPFALQVLPQGGHGYGMYAEGGHEWFPQLLDFLRDRDFLR